MTYPFESSLHSVCPDRISPAPGSHAEALRADALPGGVSWSEITSRFATADAGHHRWLPGLELGCAGRAAEAPPASQGPRATAGIHDVVFHSSGGNVDRVAGIRPRGGETLAQLIKRLHPGLSGEQLAHEVKQVLKYNHDYGNDLGDGSHLDPGKDVFLTSVKYRDAQGKITRIEGPTGRLTELTYGADGHLEGYRITAADGTIIEQCGQDGSGRYLVWKNGQTGQVGNVVVDAAGNVIVTDAAGNRVAHLTGGTDISTSYWNQLPVRSLAARGGSPVAVYEYSYEGETVSIFAQFADEPGKRVLLSQKTAPDALARLAEAQGRFVQQEQTAASYERISMQAAPGSSFSELASELGDRIAAYARYLAERINTHHYCLSGVAQILDRFGVHLHGDAAWEARAQLAADPRFRQVSMSSLRPGDIIVSGRNSAHPWGHIRVYLGGGLEASDHVQDLITGEGYGGTSVFRMTSA